MEKFPDFRKGLAPTADAYFVARTQDGETLHVLITGSDIGSRFELDPRKDNTDPVNGLGHHFRFRCTGDRKAGGYFFAKSVLQGDGKPPECEWIMESSVKGRLPKQYRFVGRLYGYEELPASDSKSTFSGTIMIPLARGSPAPASPVGKPAETGQ